MNTTHSTPGFGGMFTTLTALASPGHAALTGTPLYENVSPLGLRVQRGGAFASFRRNVGLWLQRVRQRRQLQELSDHLLDDVGLLRADIDKEAEKPFWQG